MVVVVGVVVVGVGVVVVVVVVVGGWGGNYDQTLIKQQCKFVDYSAGGASSV